MIQFILCEEEEGGSDVAFCVQPFFYRAVSDWRWAGGDYCIGRLRYTAAGIFRRDPYETRPDQCRGEEIILAERSRLWKDPESIRDESIDDTYPCSSPKFTPTGAMVDEPGSCTCVELNARNSYGGYVGIRRTIVVSLEAGGTTTLDGGTKGYEVHCQGLTPFSELNGRSSLAKPR